MKLLVDTSALLALAFRDDRHHEAAAAFVRAHPHARLVLSELGPTFIKLGQMLSSRPDLVGATLAQELSTLLDHAPADLPRCLDRNELVGK